MLLQVAHRPQPLAVLVSGSRDWVVPSGPEAIVPMASEAQKVGAGHRLVLARGGDHFNMRASFAEAGGPLGGLLLPASGWGNATLSLTDATAQLKRWQP